MLHDSTTTFGPEQPFPPQEGAGLLHTLVCCRVPPPQLLLHGPYLHELHPPTTIYLMVYYKYVLAIHFV